MALFAHHFLRSLAQSPSVRSIILAVAIVSSTALYDAQFSIADLRHTIPAYAALLLHSVTINALNHVNQHLTLNFLSPDISRALTVLAASILTLPLHLFGRAVSLFPPHPYIPLLALLPLPFLSFALLFFSRGCSQAASSTAPRSPSRSSSPPSSHSSSRHYSPDIVYGLTFFLLLLSTMYSSPTSPAWNDDPALLTPSCCYNPTSAPSWRFQIPARFSTSCCRISHSC